MTTIAKVLCDNCGKEKQEANHWFAIIANFDAAHDDGKTYAIAVAPMDGVMAVVDKDWRLVADACGQNCAVEMVSRYLSTGKIAR